jgi:hypothetical protein
MVGWHWARLAKDGRRYLGVYGNDEHGWVFHAVLDLEEVPDPEIAYAARTRGYEAQQVWRLGPHESITLDERLPPPLLAMNRLVYDDATPAQTVVLLLTRSELRTFGLPEMDT